MTGDDFAPTANWQILRLRADLLRKLRQFFEHRQFLEVETPLLSADTVIDRHLDPIPVTLPDAAGSGSGRPMWLQTSPELAMKRLLAAGGTAIYQVTRAFRACERGTLHNPEFTIAEWYRVGDSLHDGMQLLAELTQALLGGEAAEQISYRAAFQQQLGVDPHTAPVERLMEVAHQRARAIPHWLQRDDRDGWLDLLLAECVQPNLGMSRPSVVYDFPASQAGLARIRQQETLVAERFELFIRGLEIANGYHELLDPQELQHRQRLANARRQADGKPQLPEQNRLLSAMRHGLPVCSGTALGFDRLVMLASDANAIQQVIAFPIDRA